MPPGENDLAAYVTAIEAALTRARRREVAVVGHEFELARAWHAAGVPLALVLETIEEQCAAGRGGLALGYLRRHIEARARRARVAPAAEPALDRADGATTGIRDERAEARAWLARLRLWLDTRAGAPWAASRDRLEALAARLDAPAALTGQALDAALRTLDEALTDAAMDACDDETIVRFRAEADGAAARQRGRLDEQALEEALRRYVRRRARAAWSVPERG